VSRRGLAGAGLATLAGVALLVGLGVWQLKRLAWKEGLIAAVSARAHAAPTPAPPPSQWASLKPADYEYRRVAVKGDYDYADQELLFSALEDPRGRYGGVGHFVMTPLRLAGGETIIVDRGFVPDTLKAAAEKGPRGDVEVIGLMRSSERGNLFTPADDPANHEFFSRNVERLARAMRLGPHAPFVIDAEAGPDPLPEGGQTRLVFVNNHLSYAFTWFGLAAALTMVFVVYARGQASGDEPQDPAQS
jgi:surfeit locus 1 family protein